MTVEIPAWKNFLEAVSFPQQGVLLQTARALTCAGGSLERTLIPPAQARQGQFHHLAGGSARVFYPG